MPNLSTLEALATARRNRARAARVAAAAVIEAAGPDHASMALAIAMAGIWHEHAESAGTETIVCDSDTRVGSVVLW